MLLFIGIFLICPHVLYADYFNEKLLDALEKKVPARLPSREVYKQKIDIGEYYFQKRMYAQAKETFWQAIDLFPDNPEGYVNLATVHIKEGSYGNAMRILKQADQIAKEDYYQREVIFYNLGICSYMSKEYSDAARYLSKALDVYPDFGEAMYYLGLSNYKQGKKEFAFLNVFNAKYIFEKKNNAELKRQANEFLENLKKLLSHTKLIEK